jgi:hypothetical protein
MDMSLKKKIEKAKGRSPGFEIDSRDPEREIRNTLQGAWATGGLFPPCGSRKRERHDQRADQVFSNNP